MKLRLVPDDSVSEVLLLFLCGFSFVSTLLIFSDPGLNETTGVGALMALTVSGLLVHLYKKSKKNSAQENAISVKPFVYLPLVSAVFGLFFGAFK